jgi:hypothetical protein
MSSPHFNCDGTLSLQATGVSGPHGKRETLTAHDIAELHKHGW